MIHCDQEDLPTELKGIFYGLNVCFPPKFTHWNPNLQCNGIEKWGTWKVVQSWKRNRYNGISALYNKRDERTCSLSLRSTMQGSDKKMSICEWGRGPSPITGPYQHLDLGLPTPPEVWMVNICCWRKKKIKENSSLRQSKFCNAYV